MTATDMPRGEIAGFFVEEYEKHKQKKQQNYHSQHSYQEYYDDSLDEGRGESGNIWSTVITKIILLLVFLIRKIVYFTYLYIKTFIELTCKFTWETLKFIASLYRPSINFIDKYFTITLRYTLNFINDFSYSFGVWVYKYGKSKKYFKVVVGEAKYSDLDIARMAAGIGEMEQLTLHQIQDRYKIGYHPAIRVRDMRIDKMKMLGLILDSMKELKKEQSDFSTNEL